MVIILVCNNCKNTRTFGYLHVYTVHIVYDMDIYIYIYIYIYIGSVGEYQTTEQD